MARYLKVGDKFETSFGTPAGGVSYKAIRAKSVANPADRGALKEENIESYIYAHEYGGALALTGTIEGNFRPGQMLTLIYALAGTSAAATGGDAITSGTTYSLAVPGTFGIEAGEQTAMGGSFEIQYQYDGVALKSLKLDMTAKQFVVATWDWFAKNFTLGAFSAPAASDYTDERPAMFWSTSVSLFASTAFMIKAMDMTIDRHTDDTRYILGQPTLGDVGISGMTEINGTLTFSEHEYNVFKAALTGSSSGTGLTAENALGDTPFIIYFTDGSASAVKVCSIQGSHMVFTKTDTTITGQNEIVKKVSYEVYGSDFRITVAT